MISFCVALMNRGDNFARFYESLLPSLPGNELIVCDHGSTDIDLTKFDCRVVYRSLPFRRSHALNKAVEAAKGDILFFVDADMLVPPDMKDLVRRHVKSKTAWFPVCFSLYEGCPPVMEECNGWWRHTGYGMLGITKEDFIACGRWPEQFTSHGGEDDFIFSECKKRFKIVRAPQANLFHIWHPNDKEFKNQYSK